MAAAAAPAVSGGGDYGTTPTTGPVAPSGGHPMRRVKTALMAEFPEVHDLQQRKRNDQVGLEQNDDAVHCGDVRWLSTQLS